MSKKRKRRWPRVLAVIAVIFALAFWGAWNIDMARQTIQINWLSWTGGLWKLRGHVERQMVYSANLGQERQALVYLPPGYDLPINATRRYPMLYLLHGFPDPGDGWARFGLAPQLVDQNIVQGTLPAMLLILPDCHDSRLGKFGDSEYLDAPNGGGQTGTRVASFVTDDLPRWADSHYRTIRSPTARIIAGLSTGAYGAVNLGLKRPDQFGILIGLSGYYEADLKHFARDLWPAVPDPVSLAAQSPIVYLASEGKRNARQDTFVFIGDGYKDYADVREQSSRLDMALTSAGIAHTYQHLYGHHSWDMWRAMLVEALRNVAHRMEANLPARPSTKPEAVR